MTVEQKVKSISEAIEKAIQSSWEAEQKLMTIVKMVVQPICECQHQKSEEQLTVNSFTRCRHCEEVFHNQCFERHQMADPEKRVPWPYNRHEVLFIEKYIKRYFAYQKEQKALEDNEKKSNSQSQPIIQKIKSNTKKQEKQRWYYPDPQACSDCEQKKCVCIYMYRKITKKIKSN